MNRRQLMNLMGAAAVAPALPKVAINYEAETLPTSLAVSFAPDAEGGVSILYNKDGFRKLRKAMLHVWGEEYAASEREWRRLKAQA